MKRSDLSSPYHFFFNKTRMVARILPLRLLLFDASCWCLFFACHVCTSSNASFMPFPNVRDPCYDSEGEPVKCQPQISDPIFQSTVKVSETCGDDNPIVLCRTRMEDESPRRHCELCQSSGPFAHPAQYLIDEQNPNNATCWYSDKVSSNELGERRNVTITLSFRKKYDIGSIALRFCTSRPETMVIYKSRDEGKKWEPFQYFSKRCRSLFGINPRSRSSKVISTEAICSDRESDPNPPTGGLVSLRVKDSKTVVDNPSLELRIEEWSAATGIKIVLMNVYNTDPISPDHGGRAFMENVRHNRRRQTPAVEVSSGLFYGISGITIGARCTCNGHASRCEIIHGEMMCVCKHNTEGRDCEKCKPFHFDRPWRRATKNEANQCIACNCNLHARRCRFNNELYILSGKKSGGICDNCRHNTDGRHCHYCKEGYYRNKRRPITHRKACKPCRCHKFGAAGKTCNQTTGQCTCKDGVIGLTCNHCAKNYQQSTSEIAPCIKIPEGATDLAECPVRCKTSARRPNMKKFCKKNFVIQAQTTGMTDGAEWTWFTVNVLNTFRNTESVSLSSAPQHIRLRTRDVSCMCPRMRENRKYVMMGSYENSNGKLTMIIDSKGLTMPWQDGYEQRFARMMNRAKKGKCR